MRELPLDFPKMSDLNKLLAPYQKSDVRHSIIQLASTIIPYFALWYLMYQSLSVSYALTLALAVLEAGFMMRLFIFFHDCGHNSFLPSVKANKLLGFWLGVLVFTPSEHWWHSHALHHATSGNLDKRGDGDVTTLTVDEYHRNRWFGKLGYRLFRNPLIMFGLGPIYMFLIMHRLPIPNYGKKETMNVIWTNLALAAYAALMSVLMGSFKAYVMVQLPILMLGGAGGIWLFYVQHQFEDSYWERSENWNYVASALLGASFYKLPKVLQWFSGNIGFHHIHHLSPRIPNYNLEPAHVNIPIIQKYARVITVKDSFQTARLKLWNEPVKKMVGYPTAEPDPEPSRKRETSSGD